jgi:tyrosyl-tRNA synthetase
MAKAGLVSSTSEARRLIRQGAVRIDGGRLTDHQAVVAPGTDTVLIQVGSRRLCRVFFRKAASGA